MSEIEPFDWTLGADYQRRSGVLQLDNYRVRPSYTRSLASS
jgi:hypothetical protein